MCSSPGKEGRSYHGSSWKSKHQTKYAQSNLVSLINIDDIGNILICVAFNDNQWLQCCQAPHAEYDCGDIHGLKFHLFLFLKYDRLYRIWFKAGDLNIRVFSKYPLFSRKILVELIEFSNIAIQGEWKAFGATEEEWDCHKIEPGSARVWSCQGRAQ